MHACTSVLSPETYFLRSSQLLLPRVCFSLSPEVHLATHDSITYSAINLCANPSPINQGVSWELISLLRASPSCDQWYTPVRDLQMLQGNNEENICVPPHPVLLLIATSASQSTSFPKDAKAGISQSKLHRIITPFRKITRVSGVLSFPICQ